jgi:hypothetical protein
VEERTVKSSALVHRCRWLAFQVLLGAAILCLAAESSAEKDVSRNARATGRAIKDYSVEQRDEAVKQAKAALDDADARMRRLERKLDADWDKMDAAARQRARATREAMRRERNQLAEWYGGLRHGSSDAWDEVKSGFAKSYDELRRSLAKARKDF